MAFVPEEMMEEVRKRPGLWRQDMTVDQLERLTLWKEVGAVLFKDWDSINKATAYDRVLLMQKRWRSYKDAYKRELRRRRMPYYSERMHHRTYFYFERLKFLGGHEGLPEPKGEFGNGPEAAEDQDNQKEMEAADSVDPLEEQRQHTYKIQTVKPTRKRKRASRGYEYEDTEQMEMSSVPMDVQTPEEDDSDKLFLLSFVSEMRKLQPHIKMWARAQIANTMQEAVRSQFSDTRQHAASVKRKRDSSSE